MSVNDQNHCPVVIWMWWIICNLCWSYEVKKWIFLIANKAVHDIIELQEKCGTQHRDPSYKHSAFTLWCSFTYT